MRILLALSIAMFTSLLHAQVLEVNIWQPKMGGTAATMAAAAEAKAIIEKAGGSASVGVDRDGSLHFVTHHENWVDWAAMTATLAEDKAWTAFSAKWNDDPGAILVENYLLNTPMPGGDGPVYQVFIWEAMPGGSADMLQSAAQAKALHEKDGAKVAVHVDQMNRMHYSMNFDTWEAWAKFQDADHPEFDAFMQERMKNPSATLIQVYTASTM